MNPLQSKLVRSMIFLPLVIFVLTAPAAVGGLSPTVTGEAPLRATINKTDGSYAIGADGLSEPVLQAQFAIEVNHRWVCSRDYPKHEVSQSDVADDLGSAHKWTARCSGLRDAPDLTLVLRAYTALPFADVQVIANNSGSHALAVQAIRPVAADGNNIFNLGGNSSSDRIYSDAFNYGVWILDLKDAPSSMQHGVKSSAVSSVKGLAKKIPALFTSASMEPNLVIADSTIFGATTLSPMFPFTSASLSNARTVPEL